MTTHEKIYSGKTKDVYALENGNILLEFKDDVTGEGDVIDPGANTVIGKVEGKGNASLRLSSHFFEILEKKGIPSHFVSADSERNTMLVKRAVTFGDGLEFVCRLKAAGSFVRRYGRYVREGTPLDYLVEITLKDDERGDPLINEQSLCQLGLMTREEVKTAAVLTREVTGIIRHELEQ